MKTAMVKAMFFQFRVFHAIQILRTPQKIAYSNTTLRKTYNATLRIFFRESIPIQKKMRLTKEWYVYPTHTSGERTNGNDYTNRPIGSFCNGLKRL